MRKTLKTFLVFIGALSISGIIWLSYKVFLNQPVAKTLSEESSRTEEEQTQKTKPANLLEIISPTYLKGEKEGRLNILVLGLPGPGEKAPDLTDTILLISINPQNQKAAFISIPRDLYVQIPGEESFTKINALFSNFGIEKTKKKIEQITGLPIHYYVTLDLAGVKNIVNAVGGINVLVREDIFDTGFPESGTSTGYQTFQLEKGWRYLDGDTAAKFIRTRHTPRGDFDRIYRQQQILEGLRRKILASHNPFSQLPMLLKLYEAGRDHIRTDVEKISEIKRLWEIAKEINAEEVKSGVASTGPDGLLTSSHVPIGETGAYVLFPKAGEENYSDIQEFAKNIFK